MLKPSAHVGAKRRQAKQRRTHPIQLVDLALLLVYLLRAKALPRIGMCSVEDTFASLLEPINKSFIIRRKTLEKLLFYANIAHEEGAFYHPGGLGFKRWVKSMLGQYCTFDYFFNHIGELYDPQDIAYKKYLDRKREKIKRAGNA